MREFFRQVWDWAKLIGAILLVLALSAGLWYCDHVRFVY